MSNQIIEKDPTFTRAYKEVAMAYQANKEYDKAIENFKRAQKTLLLPAIGEAIVL